MKNPIVPCLWFNREAEEAVEFYLKVFKKSSKGDVLYYTEEGRDIHGQPAGLVMTINFTINGLEFTALNGGPHFKFNEAVSLQIYCDTQEEIDYYWEQLTADGGQEGPCGWLKDKFGVSWQVTPGQMNEWMKEPERGKRITSVFMKMKKLDLKALKEA